MPFSDVSVLTHARWSMDNDNATDISTATDYAVTARDMANTV